MMNAGGFLNNKSLALHKIRLNSQAYTQYNFRKKVNTRIGIVLSIWQIYINRMEK